jgi:outer membrane protein OmpA-like peptidoglycan-associated protein
VVAAPADAAALSRTAAPVATAAAPLGTERDAVADDIAQTNAVTRQANVLTDVTAPEATAPEAAAPEATLARLAPEAPRQAAPRPTATFATNPTFTPGATAAAADRQCVEDLRLMAEEARVYFPSGGVTANEGGLEQARLLGLIAQSCEGVQILVEGHSDPSGSPTLNLRLSENRAQAVIQRIAASGIETDMFVAAGLGSSQPSGVTGPQPAAYYDRRVEFRVVEERALRKASVAVSETPWAGETCVRELARAVENTALFYAPRSVSLQPQDFETALDLAMKAAQCPHARLRVVGHYSSDIQARETTHTGLLRAKALMAMLVGRGIASEQIIIAAPSYPLRSAQLQGAPGSQVQFDIILEEG